MAETHRTPVAFRTKADLSEASASASTEPAAPSPPVAARTAEAPEPPAAASAPTLSDRQAGAAAESATATPETVAPDLSAEGPKGPFRHILARTKKTVIGSTHLREELGEAGRGALGVAATPIAAFSTPLKSLNALAHGQAGQALTEMKDGATRMLGNFERLFTAPSHLVAALIANFGRGIGKATQMGAKGVGLVATSPLLLWNGFQSGMDRLVGQLDKAEGFFTKRLGSAAVPAPAPA